MTDYYKVGPDDFWDKPDYENLEWLVYWYEAGAWDGDGDAIGYDGKDLLYFNLSHCSCYGPDDSIPNGGEKVTLADLESTCVTDLDVKDEVTAQVKVLLSLGEEEV